MELGERRALVDHLSDRFARDVPQMQVRDQPNWSAMLRRYDGNPGVPPKWGPDPTDDPPLDPDPALCTLAYTLSSPRAATLMRHEATAERRLHACIRELHRLQAERRRQHNARNEPTSLREHTARNEAIAGHAVVPWKGAVSDLLLEQHETMRNEPTVQPRDSVRNEATSLAHQAAVRDACLDPDLANRLAGAHPADVKDKPILPPLSGEVSSTVKNEPIMPRPYSSNPVPGTAQTERNEPIPVVRISAPATSRSAQRPSWDRQSIQSSDLLDRLIRNAGRRHAAQDQSQPRANPPFSNRHARRAKR